MVVIGGERGRRVVASPRRGVAESLQLGLLGVIGKPLVAPDAGQRDDLVASETAVRLAVTKSDGALSSKTARTASSGERERTSSRADPSFFTFYENWLSGEHLDAHLAAPHLVEFASKMGDLLDENGLTVNRVRRIA